MKDLLRHPVARMLPLVAAALLLSGCAEVIGGLTAMTAAAIAAIVFLIAAGIAVFFLVARAVAFVLSGICWLLAIIILIAILA